MEGCVMEYTAQEQAEHLKQWIEALRSGKYEQGMHKLRIGDRYCCLGVACDISGLGKWEMANIAIPQDMYVNTPHQYRVGDKMKLATLPIPVKDWIGIWDENAFELLVDANDKGVSFNQIADIIESNNFE